MKKLYQLEYEVAELRKKCLNRIDNSYDKYEITLKEVLDAGFNNVFIKNLLSTKKYVGMYKDLENKYVVGNYYLKDKNILNANVIFVDYEITEDYYGNYLNVYCKFVDNKYKKMLEDFVEGNR